jgi:hypothetical protein
MQSLPWQRTYSTISRTTIARLDLSSLKFRASPEPEQLLSAVATLIVCVVFASRDPAIASIDRSCAEEPDLDIELSGTPRSTMVGRRDLGALPAFSSELYVADEFV